MEYQDLLNVISKEYSEILKENLVGIYVHGSIAFGCFNPEKSDIDFLVVVNNSLTPGVKEQLIATLLRLDDSCPVSYTHLDYGITAVFSAVNAACSFEDIQKNCRKDMAFLADSVMRTLRLNNI